MGQGVAGFAVKPTAVFAAKGSWQVNERGPLRAALVNHLEAEDATLLWQVFVEGDGRTVRMRLRLHWRGEGRVVNSSSRLRSGCCAVATVFPARCWNGGWMGLSGRCATAWSWLASVNVWPSSAPTLTAWTCNRRHDAPDSAAVSAARVHGWVPVGHRAIPTASRTRANTISSSR